jgi:hypothetical protein
MRPRFERNDLNTFETGVKVFFSEPRLPQNPKIQEFRKIKDFIYSDEEVIRKLDRNPSIILYYSIFKRDVNATYSKTPTGKGLAGALFMTHL